MPRMAAAGNDWNEEKERKELRIRMARRIGDRLQRLRRRKKWTSEKLAWESEISAAYMSLLENGKHLPSLPVLARIARALGVKIKDVLDIGI